MSSVLDQPGIREIMDRGELVPDTMVPILSPRMMIGVGVGSLIVPSCRCSSHVLVMETCIWLH